MSARRSLTCSHYVLRLFRRRMSLPAVSSSLSSAPLPVPLASPLPATPIRSLAVYGTLRDDDDSGAPWTAPFVADVDVATFGAVRGCKMFWSKTLNYPFATLTHDPADIVRVRVLHWTDGAAFAAKVAAADAIEGFIAADETASEYVRRAVHVDMTDRAVFSCDRIIAYMYFAATASAVDGAVEVIGGDWLTRHSQSFINPTYPR